MKIMLVIGCLIALCMSVPAVAKDVNVNGYYRNDGTYVRPHVRSSPNSTRIDNYGSSTNDSQLMNPASRDYDRDGTSNYLDTDDDNDGIGDDSDGSQYGQ